MIALGIDTSNYATSVALFDGDLVLGKVKRYLPVKERMLGLRQSDAVFSHIQALPQVFEELGEQADLSKVDVIGVSSRPRDIDGSYMPCFLAGVAAAKSAGAVSAKPVYEFSHQQGHVMAALYGSGLHRENKLSFLAFHISGGTTDALVCTFEDGGLHVDTAATSLDLFAGQAVDRVGVMMGFDFPAGEKLSSLAEKSSVKDYAKPTLKGGNCCLSGLENKCRSMFERSVPHADIARYCLLSIQKAVAEMARFQLKNNSGYPLIFAGGVMSSSVIRAELRNEFPEAHFCEPSWLSSDNAVGTAALALNLEEYK